MELSCKTEYGILALLELADGYVLREPLQIRQIAASQNIPDRYLEQLLASLRRYGIIRSQRGAKGGYVLAREPHKITLAEVVECLEGLEDQTIHTSETKKRSLDEQVIRDVWKEVSDAAQAVLQRHTLQDLCALRDAKRQLNIMYYI